MRRGGRTGTQPQAITAAACPHGVGSGHAQRREGASVFRSEERVKNVLIIGTGRFGRYTIETLNDLGHEILAVDRVEDRVNQILPYVAEAEIGDSTNESFMSELGVDEFDLCIIAIGDDFMSSLETTLLLHDLGAKYIVARATSESQEKVLLRCGANAVVFPERELGRWCAVRYSADNIADYIELPSGYTILELDIPTEWEGKTLGELDVRRKYGLNILGIGKGDNMQMNLSHETLLGPGDNMLVLGQFEHLKKLFHL